MLQISHTPIRMELWNITKKVFWYDNIICYPKLWHFCRVGGNFWNVQRDLARSVSNSTVYTGLVCSPGQGSELQSVVSGSRVTTCAGQCPPCSAGFRMLG